MDSELKELLGQFWKLSKHMRKIGFLLRSLEEEIKKIGNVGLKEFSRLLYYIN